VVQEVFSIKRNFMPLIHKLFQVFVTLALTAVAARAQQTAIIPITNTTNSNGAFVRGASNDGKRVVFESSNDYTGENKDGNNEIFVYDADLRKIIQITKTGNQSGTSGGGGGVVLQANNCPGGCEPASFTPTNAVPAISGDGTRIVFASSSGLLTDIPNPDGNVELYLATLPRGATVATMVALRDAGVPLPAFAFCLSPWTDLAATGVSSLTNARRDPMFYGDALKPIGQIYLHGASATDPLASPLYADLTGLPPLHAFVSNTEVLYDDAVGLIARAEQCGVEARLHIADRQPHVWPVFVGMIPEAPATIQEVVELIERKVKIKALGQVAGTFSSVEKISA
jgi:hypothetical protein